MEEFTYEGGFEYWQILITRKCPRPWLETIVGWFESHSENQLVN